MKPGLYVHVPFCDGKCRYCAFYSVRYVEEIAEQYLSALEREIELRGETLASLGPATAYIGGGTPTVLSEAQLARLCRAIARAAGGKRFEEWTAEANPGSLTFGKLDVLKRAGVTRISLGAQSFDGSVLAQLGRRHTATDVFKAVEAIREAGFANMGLDLMACVPGVTRAMWSATLTAARELELEHLSVYALTVEEGSALWDMVKNRKARMLGEDEQLAMLHEAEDALTEAGFIRYEISNYALPGYECAHNVSCWRGGDYIGCGPSGASHLAGTRWTSAPDLGRYLAALDAGELPPAEVETLSPHTRALEMLIFGLRLSDGVAPEAIVRSVGASERDSEKWIAVLRRLSESKLLSLRGSRWTLTRRGRDLADRVAVELME